MNDLAGGIVNALEYIEDNLTEQLSVEEISARAYLSPFYFQKIFHVLCGFTLGEYIRMRRLSCAAEELMSGGGKVIDTALRYGYESPDSFARAFTAFHGVSPSAVKSGGAGGIVIRSFAPLRIKLSLEGGNMLEYKIVEKAAFSVVGYSKMFNTETSYKEIPDYWTEHFQAGKGDIIKGEFGVCIDSDGKDFEYLIADTYLPWNEIPEDCKTVFFEGGLWAVFPCNLASLQKVNTKIWSEWLPNLKGYKLRGNYNLEMYTPPAEKPEDTYSEIWVPVEKI